MNKQYGLSLIELMISITLGLLLMSGVVQMFLSSKNVYVSQKGMSNIQETGRLALEFISRDLRMAGYFGCLKVDKSDTPRLIDETSSNPSSFGLVGLNKDFSTPLRGYNTSSNNAADRLPDGVNVDLGTAFTIKPNSDVLVIRGANEPGMSIKTKNNMTQAFGYTDEGTTEGFAQDTIAVISDCKQGHIFKVSGAPQVASNTVTLNFSAWASTFALPDQTEEYLQGMILPIHTYIYFVATANGRQQPSLWQRIDNKDAVEILQGVDDIAITYSINDGSSYITAAAVGSANWYKVKSVKIEIVAVETGNGTNESAQKYMFKGVLQDPSVANPNDRSLRQVFSATYGIRARLNAN